MSQRGLQLAPWGHPHPCLLQSHYSHPLSESEDGEGEDGEDEDDEDEDGESEDGEDEDVIVRM